MSGSGLQQAWDEALAAQVHDRGPWRVLADLLLSKGDPRGEWLQLELDAEEGPLKGLARGRLPQLRELLGPELSPVGLRSTEPWRTVLVGGLLAVRQARRADDARWRTVRRLAFASEPERPPRAAWALTPVAGPPLPWLEVLDGLEDEALPLLAERSTFPSLRRVRCQWPLGVPLTGRLSTAEWRAAWQQVRSKQSQLGDVDIGWCGVTPFAFERLDVMAELDLERLRVESGPDDLRTLHDWARRRAMRGEFVAQLRDSSLKGARVVLGGEVLVLRCVPSVEREARAQVVRSWRGRAYEPAVRVEVLSS